MTNNRSNNPDQELTQDYKPKCGIIMPISAINGLSENHWVDVRNLLFNIIEDAGFEPNIVSDGSDVGVIHNRIINNIYSSDIIVCDVSEKNPNVMLELGLRLAFDKPVIIIKDDQTSYSFDTSPIEHVGYPRDLRYTLIEEFKIKLKSKLQNTYKKATEDDNYTTFLGHFKILNPVKLETKEVSALELFQNFMNEIKSEINSLKRSNVNNARNRYTNYHHNNDELSLKIEIKDLIMTYCKVRSLNVQHLDDSNKKNIISKVYSDFIMKAMDIPIRYIEESLTELELNPNY